MQNTETASHHTSDSLDNLLPTYINFVRIMGWVIIAISGLIFAIVAVALPLTGQFFWPFMVAGVVFLVVGIIVTRVVTTHYLLAVYLLCMAQIFVVPFGCLFMFGMKRSVIIGVIVWGIILGGLLLGRRAATMLTAWAFFLVLLGFALEATKLTPPPLFTEETIPAFAFTILNLVFILAIIIVFYPIVVIFSTTMSSVLQQLSERAAAQEKLNQHLLDVQLQERAVSEQVNNLATSLAATAEQQATEAGRQAQEATELSRTLSELSVAAEHITGAARQVAESASTSQDSASSGRKATDDAVQAMTMISQQVGIINEQIVNLSNQVTRINDVLDLVTDVADETHLLSLNAAIESISVGKLGNRFSVIATEVKELADRTKKGVEEVQVLLSTITDSAHQTVSATEQGLQQSHIGAELATRAGQAHEDILEAVERTAQYAQLISTTTEQQRIASKQAVETVGQFSRAAQEAAATSSQILEVVRQLSAMSSQLALTAASQPIPPNISALPPSSGVAVSPARKMLLET